MATRISELLAAAAARTVPVVRGIDDKHLAKPTPCAEFAVRDLANHLFQVVVNFQAVAAKGTVGWEKTPDYVAGEEIGGGDWRDRFAAETGTLVEAWSAPAAVEGDNPAMGMPQALAGNVVLVDLLVHGWDLAQATGQSYQPDPEVVAAVGPFTEQMAPMGRQMGVFGEMTDFPPDASDFARMLAHTGRKAA